MCLAIPGKLIEAGESGLGRGGKADFGGVTRTVSLDFVPTANIGDYVLVHAGFAIGLIDEDEARRRYALLEQMRASAGEEPS